MSRCCVARLSCALVVPCVLGVLRGAEATQATSPPQTQIVSYTVYEDPDAPNPTPIWMVALLLVEADASGNDVGWAVGEVTIYEINDPSADRVWVHTAPNVDTPDGLWWVNHADPANPQLQEFDLPPLVSGLAAAEDPIDPDLNYEFEGRAYVAPPGGPQFAATAAIDLRFIEYQSPWPVIDRQDEPVEILDDPAPPMDQ